MSSTIAFPNSLPKPLPTYTVGFLGKRTEFESESGLPIRRRKTSTQIRTFNLEWVFSGVEYAAFRDWFYNSLADGTRSFDIELLDDSIELVWYTVNIPTASYQASLQPGMLWNVQMQVMSRTPGFTDRVAGSAQLQGLTTLEFSGTARLVNPGVILLGRANLEFRSTGRLYLTTKGSATIEFTASGKLPKIYRGLANIEFDLRGQLFDPAALNLAAEDLTLVDDSDTILVSDS